jgi:hypothetical protein
VIGQSAKLAGCKVRLVGKGALAYLGDDEMRLDAELVQHLE